MFGFVSVVKTAKGYWREGLSPPSVPGVYWGGEQLMVSHFTWRDSFRWLLFALDWDCVLDDGVKGEREGGWRFSLEGGVGCWLLQRAWGRQRERERETLGSLGAFHSPFHDLYIDLGADWICVPKPIVSAVGNEPANRLSTPGSHSTSALNLKKKK